jgi:hypothetical protein
MTSASDIPAQAPAGSPWEAWAIADQFHGRFYAETAGFNPKAGNPKAGNPKAGSMLGGAV